jgi:hypothetical protein
MSQRGKLQSLVNSKFLLKFGSSQLQEMQPCFVLTVVQISMNFGSLVTDVVVTDAI